MKHDTKIRVSPLLIVLVVMVPAVQAALIVDAGGDRIALAGERSPSSPPAMARTFSTR